MEQLDAQAPGVSESTPLQRSGGSWTWDDFALLASSLDLLDTTPQQPSAMNTGFGLLDGYTCNAEGTDGQGGDGVLIDLTSGLSPESSGMQSQVYSSPNETVSYDSAASQLGMQATFQVQSMTSDGLLDVGASTVAQNFETESLNYDSGFGSSVPTVAEEELGHETRLTINFDVLHHQKRAKRILANRESAKRSRIKKSAYVKELERKQVQELSSQHKELNMTIIGLRDENNSLKAAYNSVNDHLLRVCTQWMRMLPMVSAVVGMPAMPGPL